MRELGTLTCLRIEKRKQEDHMLEYILKQQEIMEKTYDRSPSVKLGLAASSAPDSACILTFALLLGLPTGKLPILTRSER